MIPKQAWERRLDNPLPSSSVHNYSTPPLLEALGLLPLAYRVSSHIAQEKREGRESVFDLNGLTLHPPNPGPFSGCPLGGIGAGGIGRGFRGEFRRWSMFPGKYGHRIVWPDQFSVRVERAGKAHSAVLSTLDGGEGNFLGSWKWSSVRNSDVTSHALFPRSWLVFEEPVPGIRVIIRQISPFIPHNYAESSFPVCVFQVEVENTWAAAAEVSVMFTFQSGDGGPQDDKGDRFHIPFHYCRDEADSVLGLYDSVPISGVQMMFSHATPIVSRRKDRETMSEGSDTTSPPTDDISGQHDGKCAVVDRCSIAIATTTDNLLFRNDLFEETIQSPFDQLGKIGSDGEISYCPKFVASAESVDEDGESIEDWSSSAKQLWEQFHETGTISPITSGGSPFKSREGIVVASAVCLRKTVLPGSNEMKSFPFSLAWDVPFATFGSGRSVPRYYTKFWGKSGENAAALASYGLLHAVSWERDICEWQADSLLSRNQQRSSAVPVSESSDGWRVHDECEASFRDRESFQQERLDLPDFYACLLFNELYFLVDGGSIWTDTSAGEPNSRTVESSLNLGTMSIDAELLFQQQLAASVNGSRLHAVEFHCREVNVLIEGCHGDQRLVGQFLYLEGHEYLMYNTYDVHFYASFALMHLFPKLELSVQIDFSRSVSLEDLSTRQMLSDGSQQLRKVKGVVPHDLGSPYEDPWGTVNAYNLQNVSQWKDLGPKYVLQVYRDYYYSIGKSTEILEMHFSTVLEVMTLMMAFDKDGDGMIENSGFPDQTYDIWIARGIHAYCGGLWIAACSAVAEMATLLGSPEVAERFHDSARRARAAYVRALWNGSYLNYDDSHSKHSNSIMADMMAGQWYANACSLPPIVPREVALSCYRTIFEFNVRKFGCGSLIGAVNGMTPDGRVDECCMQSREVWTGTTYGLAAGMVMEAEFYRKTINEISRQNTPFYVENYAELFDESSADLKLPIPAELTLAGLREREVELRTMAFRTAEGIFEGGWKKFGYWFATPEAWERNGNYRSLGYMRPLAVWAMQCKLDMSTIS